MELFNKNSIEDKKLKLIISGSTHIHSEPLLILALDKYYLRDRIEEVVVGQEPGMTQCGRIWAIANDIRVKRFVRYRDASNNRRTNVVKKLQMVGYADAILFITDGIVSKADQVLEVAKEFIGLEVFIYDIKKEEGE